LTKLEKLAKNFLQKSQEIMTFAEGKKITLNWAVFCASGWRAAAFASAVLLTSSPVDTLLLVYVK